MCLMCFYPIPFLFEHSFFCSISLHSGFVRNVWHCARSYVGNTANCCVCVVTVYSFHLYKLECINCSRFISFTQILRSRMVYILQHINTVAGSGEKAGINRCSKPSRERTTTHRAKHREWEKELCAVKWMRCHSVCNLIMFTFSAGGR